MVYATRAALAEALRRVVAAGIVLDGAADHGVGESIYFARTAREWRGIVWRPGEAIMAAHFGPAGDVHAPTRFAQTAERARS